MSKTLIKNAKDHKASQISTEVGQRILANVKQQIKDAKADIYKQFAKPIAESIDSEDSEDPVDALEGIQYDEESEGWVVFEENLSDEEIEERKLVIKVNSKGKRTKKVVCGPGKKFQGGRCVIQKAGEKLSRKKGSKKAVRKKKGKSQAQAKRKTKIALKKRKAQGL